MRIADLLHDKGADVVTVRPETRVDRLLERLARHNVGAAVVVDRGAVAGIASERDVVRGLPEHGAGLLDQPVSALMTAPVITCSPRDTVEALTVVMTENRVRHVPVLTAGALVGIVSIGDVVKSRIRRLEHDREQLEAYITQG
ncbi:CBS domain-containing protein [Nocardiopsis coralliicola]